MKVLAIIVLIIIFPLFFLAIFGLSVKQTVQKPEFIKKELVEQNAYEKINRNLPEIVSLLGENKDSGEPPILTNAEVGLLLQQTLTADALKQNTEMFLDGTSGKQSSSATQTQVTYNINKLIEVKYNALPVCTSQVETGDMSCRPPGVTFEQVLAQLPTQGNNPLFSAGNTSETINLESPENPQPQSAPGLSSFSTIGKFTNMTYILTFIILLIIYFLARGYAGSWLGSGKVFGVFLAVLSVLSLLLNILLSLFTKPLVNDISGFESKAPSLKKELVIPLLNNIFSKVSQMTNKISIVSASIGVVLFIVFFIITRRKKKNQPVLAET